MGSSGSVPATVDFHSPPVEEEFFKSYDTPLLLKKASVGLISSHLEEVALTGATNKEDEDAFVHSNELFSSDFLNRVNALAHNEIERGMFLTFVFNRLWKNIIFQDLKQTVMESTFTHFQGAQRLNSLSDTARKVVMDEYYPNPGSPLNLKSFLKYMSFNEIRALLLAVTLSSYFDCRSHLDFGLDTSINAATSCDILLNSLYVRTEEIAYLNSVEDRNRRLKEFLEECGEDRVVDPEDILQLICTHSTPEDLESLLLTGDWHNTFVTGISRIPLSLTVWNLGELPEESHQISLSFPILYSNKITSDNSSSSLHYSTTSTSPPETENNSPYSSSYSVNSMNGNRHGYDEVSYLIESSKYPSAGQRTHIHQMIAAKRELFFLKQYFDPNTYLNGQLNNQLPKYLQNFQQSLYYSDALKVAVIPQISNDNSKSSKDTHGQVITPPNRDPILFTSLPVLSKNNNYLITVHSQLRNFAADKTFYYLVDFLVFCIGGIQMQNKL